VAWRHRQAKKKNNYLSIEIKVWRVNTSHRQTEYGKYPILESERMDYFKDILIWIIGNRSQDRKVRGASNYVIICVCTVPQMQTVGDGLWFTPL
jgi:hypothetical protein